MSEVARGDTGALEDAAYSTLMEDLGEDSVDDSVLDELVASGDRRGGGKRAGTDEVLERLESVDPEAAEVMRGMQRRMSQSINAERTLSERLARLEGKLESSAAPAAQPPQPPEGISEDNLRLFQQMADYLGYVPRHEVEARETERSTESQVDSALRRGVELYGEDFGVLNEDGRVELNPEVKDRLAARLQALQDPKRGITPLELYQLEFGGTRDARGESGRVSRGPARPGRANVTRRSTGLENVRIYDPGRGDTSDAVLDRAWVLGKRKLFGG